MSIQSEINRIRGSVDRAYAAVEEQGGVLPEARTCGNLEDAVRSIPSSVKGRRPADWLELPEPEDNQIYLLVHIPQGGRELLAFTATCAGSYTVELGTAHNRVFTAACLDRADSGAKYEAELLSGSYGDLTEDGMVQAVVRVSGADLETWAPSTHSRGGCSTDWHIVEIACRLPKGTAVTCGNSTAPLALRRLRRFSWTGTNRAVSMAEMFYFCTSLEVVTALDTSSVTNMDYMFSACYALWSIPALDTSSVTSMSNAFSFCLTLETVPWMDTSHVTAMNSLFYNCKSLQSVPALDTSSVVSMPSIFCNCEALPEVPALNLSNVTNASSLFNNCLSLRTVPPLDLPNATAMGSIFYKCRALREIPFLSAAKATTMGNAFSFLDSLCTLRLDPNVTGWAGCDLVLSTAFFDHDALVALFQSLPAVTKSRTITLSGSPGRTELTQEEKAIATGKNWVLAGVDA